MTIDLAGWQSPETRMELVWTTKGAGADVRSEMTTTTKTTGPRKKTRPAKPPEANEQGK